MQVPFARLIAKEKIKEIKRYHIDGVYRLDKQEKNVGTNWEFYQCVRMHACIFCS